MKTYLLAILLSAVAITSAVAETFVAPVRRHQPKPREQPTAPVTRTEVTGVIPRGIRGGNFLQMFNPRAPRKYGTAEEAITYDPHEPGKWKGIKFFEFRF